MGKGWDNIGISFNTEVWEKCLRVLKPGGHLLAFGGSRTFHRIACAIEDSGFEIRDTIMWLYGSGFPKSMDIGKTLNKKENNGKTNQWQGWGTCLKPAFEPIIVARKPFKGSLVDNVIKWGVGGLNIDECRVKTQDDLYRKPCENGSIYSQQEKKYTTGTMSDNYKLGRFPANLILTYEQMTFDEVCGGFPYTNGGNRHNIVTRLEDSTSYGGKAGSINTRNEFNDSGSACRYFYCAKASKKDRDEGLDAFNQEKVNDGRHTPIDNPFQRGETPRKNTHPTVKPAELMQYLIRLVTPNGGTVLDPFMGSGSTGKAAMYENKERNKNYSFIGIEKEPEYFKIAKARINYI